MSAIFFSLYILYICSQHLGLDHQSRQLLDEQRGTVTQPEPMEEDVDAEFNTGENRTSDHEDGDLEPSQQQQSFAHALRDVVHNP